MRHIVSYVQYVGITVFLVQRRLFVYKETYLFICVVYLNYEQFCKYFIIQDSKGYNYRLTVPK